MAVPDGLELFESVPHAAPLQPEPDRVQVTPLFCGSFCTVAVKACDCPVCTDALVGDTLMPTGGGGAVTLMVAVAVLVASATEVAVSMIVAGFGAVVGAV
jgi:hypothetical protein